MRLLLLMLVSALLVVGCRTVNTVEPEQPFSPPAVIDPRVSVTDITLSQALRLISVNSAETAGGLLRVQVVIQNTANSPRSFAYKFEWMDATGLLLQSPTSVWLPLRLMGEEVGTISGVSPQPGARDFRLKLMESAHN